MSTEAVTVPNNLFCVLSSLPVCEIWLRLLMCWPGYGTCWIASWMQYSVMAKSPKRCKSHQSWVVAFVAKQGEEQEQEACFSGGLASQTQSQSWRREEMHVLKGVNPSLNQSSRGAGPPEVPSLELCPAAHAWMLPWWEATCGVRTALAAAPNFMARKQGGWTGHPQNITACCKSAPSFLFCAALIANADISSAPPLIQKLCLGKQ